MSLCLPSPHPWVLPGPRVQGLQFIHFIRFTRDKRIIWKMCLNAESGTLHARAVSSTGCAPPSGAAWPLDTVTNHCNRNRPKGGLWCSNREWVVTGSYNRGEIGLLRPCGSWRTSPHCFVPHPTPTSEKTDSKRQHPKTTPQPHWRPEKRELWRRGSEGQLCPDWLQPGLSFLVFFSLGT